ncbi:HD domain-containing protein [soil metagenome]
MNLPYEPVLRQVGTIADALGVETYAVGGAVRDALLKRKTTDIDFVSVGEGAGILLAREVAKRLGDGKATVYKSFGTAAVTLRPRADLDLAEDLHLEFVGARRESYDRTSRKPAVEDGTLEDDQRRRDFTVNALAIALNSERFGELVDPFGGLADLAAQRLRTPLDPIVTFDDDPLRMLRAARFSAQLRFEIVPEALEAMRDRASRIEIVSTERITDELQKMIATRRPSVGFATLFETGVLEHFFPELAALHGVEEVAGHRHKDNFYHTLEVLDNLAEAQRSAGVSPDARHAADDEEGSLTRETRAHYLRLSALLHDIAKPLTKRFVSGSGWTFHGHEDRGARMIPDLFRSLTLPLDERMKYTQLMVRLHHRPVSLVDDEVTDSAVRRLLFDAGDAIEDLMMLVRADITSKNPRRVRRYLSAFDRVEEKFAEVEQKDRLRAWQPPVDGTELMEILGVKEGVAVGIAKEWIREAILDGEIPNENAAARAFAEARKNDALRRERLFNLAVRALGRERRAGIGAIKEAVFWDDLPEDDDEALTRLLHADEQSAGDGADD